MHVLRQDIFFQVRALKNQKIFSF